MRESANGRQKGGEANIGRAAATGRVEYVGVRGLTAAASFWTGKSGFEFRPRFDVPVRVFEADVRYTRDRFEARAQFADVSVVNAADLNDAITRQSGVNPNVASTLRGSYVEASYRVIAGRAWGDVGAFLRYENADTQYRMPADYLPLDQFDRDSLTVGAHLLARP